jgi:hypothetical protein
MIFLYDGLGSKPVSPGGTVMPAAPSMLKALPAIASESGAYGSDGSGSIGFAMKKNCSDTLIIFIIIL